MSKTTLSIIGSAGRKDDAQYVNLELYNKMLNEIEHIINHVFKLSYENIELVSGGAAFSDHLAVSLFNRYSFSGLTLYLPCEFDFKKSQYLDNGDYQWFNNPGKTSNYYHSNFSKLLNINSLKEISDLQKSPNVTFDCSGKGFLNRNTFISKSDYLIAFTNSENDQVLKTGGTLDTWKKSKSIKIHKSLRLL